MFIILNFITRSIPLVDMGGHCACIVDADVGSLGSGDCVAATVENGARAATHLDVGLGDVGLGQIVVGVGRYAVAEFWGGVVVVTVAATKELANEDFVVFAGVLLCREHKGAVFVFVLFVLSFSISFVACNAIGYSLRKFVRNGRRCLIDRGTDGSCDVVAAENVVDENVVAHLFAIDMDEGSAADVGLAGTAEDVAVKIDGADGDGGVATGVAFTATAIDVAVDFWLGMSDVEHRAWSHEQDCA